MAPPLTAARNGPGARRVLVWLIPMAWTVSLGLWGLSRQDSVWRDEAATWMVARRSTAEIWHMLGNIDVVHGCYYLLMHALFECFGAGTTTLRLPSVLAVAVAAACVGLIGHRLSGAWVGPAGGMAFGLLPAVQFHLQEGRPYAMVAACAGIATWLLVVLLQGRGRTVHWIAYGATVLTSGFLNWLSLLVLPAHLATLVWARAGRSVWKRWAAASAAATACVLPLVLFSRGQSAQVLWIPPLTWHMLIGPAVLLAIGGAGALLDRPRTGRLSVATVGLPLLVVPQSGLVGLSLFQPLFLDRYVLFSMVGLALLIGAAVGAAVRAVRARHPRASVWVVPAVVVVATVALLPQSLAKRSPSSRVDDVLAVASDVRRMKEPGNAVLFLPSVRRDTQSVSPGAFSGLRDIALVRTPGESGTLEGVEASPERIRAVMLTQRRILLVTDSHRAAAPVTAARDKVKASVLKEYFTAVADKQVRGRRVTVYARIAPAR
ncbi:glycosyltransferase family 39 protein [Streptomyces sp. NBC_01754]|uniref:glycosyltransferase family 39 protein n=1 Tax=Streptomyces sp. NBC_01754 TaxID=2975930 RepID=UPI002DD945E3|nr:glycosyltransferase family 39 protein [Streptomyces sp. NBC_01754]WSC93099.1 glycosyltransferase family 39 protein [Streptomyces sp. NBC_01754]